MKLGAAMVAALAAAGIGSNGWCVSAQLEQQQQQGWRPAGDDVAAVVWPGIKHASLMQVQPTLCVCIPRIVSEAIHGDILCDVDAMDDDGGGLSVKCEWGCVKQQLCGGCAAGVPFVCLWAARQAVGGSSRRCTSCLLRALL